MRQYVWTVFPVALLELLYPKMASSLTHLAARSGWLDSWRPGVLFFLFLWLDWASSHKVVSRYIHYMGQGSLRISIPPSCFGPKQSWNQPRFKGIKKYIPLLDEWIAMWHCRRPSGIEDGVVTIFGKYKKPLGGRVRGRSDISPSILPKKKTQNKTKHSLTLESI